MLSNNSKNNDTTNHPKERKIKSEKYKSFVNMVERNSPGDQNNHDGGSYLLFEELERAKCRIEERDDLIK
jgi:hypothetical protein